MTFSVAVAHLPLAAALLAASLLVADARHFAATGSAELPLTTPQQHARWLSERIGADDLPPAILSVRGGASSIPTADGGAESSPVGTPAWIALCGALAPMASTLTFMAPTPTVLDIARQKSVGDLPLLPYSSLVANASVWMLYGILLGERKVWSCNSAGFMLGLYYFATFARYSPKRSPTLPGSVAAHARASGAVAAAACAAAWFLPRKRAAEVLGKAGVAICIGLFASPLAAVQTVIRTKSASSIPLPFAVATACNCALWSVVGVLDMKDVNVALPNLLGMTFGVIQVMLKLWYGDRAKGNEQQQIGTDRNRNV